MSAPAWMPFYTADYLAGTTHLSRAQHGSYLLLIIHYWNKGGLPDDDRLLARITKMTDREWRAEKAILAEFFSEGWRHPRIEKEREKAQQKSDKRAEAGARGGEAKALKNNGGQLANASNLPEQKAAVAVASSSESEKKKVTIASAMDADLASPAPVYADAKHELWGEGPPLLESLGIASSRIRPMIGRWCRDARDDCAVVLGAIRRARDGRVQEPVSWITRAIATESTHDRSRNTRPQSGADTAFAVGNELLDQLRNGGRRAPGVAGAVDAERLGDGRYRL